MAVASVGKEKKELGGFLKIVMSEEESPKCKEGSAKEE
jgi:hypothetical protein